MCTCVYLRKLCILAAAAATFHSDILHPFNICVFMRTSWPRSLEISALWHRLISFSTAAAFLKSRVFFWVYKRLLLQEVKVEILFCITFFHIRSSTKFIYLSLDSFVAQFTFLFHRLSFFVLISAPKKLSILVYVERMSLLPQRPGGLFVLPLIDIQRGNLG